MRPFQTAVRRRPNASSSAKFVDRKPSICGGDEYGRTNGSMARCIATQPREALSRVESMITQWAAMRPADEDDSEMIRLNDVNIQALSPSRLVAPDHAHNRSPRHEGDVVITHDSVRLRLPPARYAQGKLIGRIVSTGIGRKILDRARMYEKNPPAECLDISEIACSSVKRRSLVRRFLA